MKVKASKLCAMRGHDWPTATTRDGLRIYGARCRRCGKKHHSRVMTSQEQYERANARQRRRGRKIRIQRPQPSFRMTAEDMRLVVPFPNRWAKFKHKIRKHIENRKERRHVERQRQTQDRRG